MRFSQLSFNFKEIAREKITILFLLFAGVLFFRYIFQPMISPDSVFRWEHMAELIFLKGRISFYPPQFINDFIIYPYPDGFPPFVSSLYAFLYICAGRILPVLSVFFVILQFFLCSYFVYKTSFILSRNKNAAFLSFIALLSSSTFFFAIFLGQETGWIAAALSGFLYYLILLKRDKENRNFHILAALCLGIAGLCREYGPVLLFTAIPVMFFWGIDKKYILKIVLLSFLVISPFYIRNFIIFGNPFYPLYFYDKYNYNVVHRGIMNEYSKQFSLFNNPSLLLDALKFALLGMPFQLITFILIFKEKKLYPFAFFSIVILAVWVFSTGYTCGGIFYSMRVLAPFIVCLSIPFGIIFAKIASLTLMKLWFRIALSLIIIFSFLSCLTTPLFFFKIKPKYWLKVAFKRREGIEAKIFKYTASLPKGALILTDSALYSAYLYRKGDAQVTLIPLWSEELKFLFDDKENFEEKIEKLKNAGIFFIMRTIDTKNNDYFERFEFFRLYPKKLPEIVRGSDSSIYQIR